MKLEKFTNQEADDLINQMRAENKTNKRPHMKDHVIHFRKICNCLVAGKTKTTKAIAAEMGIALPTLQKLLTAELDENFHIRAPVLGMIQDYSKKYAHYERAGNEPELNAWREHLKKNKLEEVTIKLDPEIQPGIRQPTATTPSAQLIKALNDLRQEMAGGITITIKIKK